MRWWKSRGGGDHVTMRVEHTLSIEEMAAYWIVSLPFGEVQMPPSKAKLEVEVRRQLRHTLVDGCSIGGVPGTERYDGYFDWEETQAAVVERIRELFML